MRRAKSIRLMIGTRMRVSMNFVLLIRYLVSRESTTVSEAAAAMSLSLKSIRRYLGAIQQMGLQVTCTYQPGRGLEANKNYSLSGEDFIDWLSSL